jgi:sec-independent protein translocase protein TatA
MLRNLFDQPFALLIIVLLIVVLFGATRLPNAARQVGRSMRIFKSEVKQMKDEGKDEKADDGTARPASSSPEPLEGRIVADDNPPRTDPLDDPTPTDRARHDV